MWPYMPDGMTAALYLDAGEPDAATSCTSGSEGGGWKSTHRVTRWPPTLLDGLFFLDLPGTEQKQSIWNMYLQRFEIEANQTLPDDRNWTGSEIRACCRLAALLDVPLVQAAQNIVPIAVTSNESVERLRNWATGRCLSADQSGIYHCGGSGNKKRRNTIRPSQN